MCPKSFCSRSFKMPADVSGAFRQFFGTVVPFLFRHGRVGLFGRCSGIRSGIPFRVLRAPSRRRLRTFTTYRLPRGFEIALRKFEIPFVLVDDPIRKSAMGLRRFMSSAFAKSSVALSSSGANLGHPSSHGHEAVVVGKLRHAFFGPEVRFFRILFLRWP